MAGKNRQARRRVALDSSGLRSIDVYAADVSSGWRIVRQVTALLAYDKVASGKWRELFDDFGNFYGVQVIAAIKSDAELLSNGDSAATITNLESQRNAGLEGRSLTVGRSEDFRINRHHPVTGKVQPPEDLIERAIAKVQQWPFPASRIDNGRKSVIYGDRAPRVYPRMK